MLPEEKSCKYRTVKILEFLRDKCPVESFSPTEITSELIEEYTQSDVLTTNHIFNVLSAADVLDKIVSKRGGYRRVKFKIKGVVGGI